MIVWLTQDIYIRAEEHNFILCRRRLNKKGEVTHKNLGYYSEFAHAVTDSLNKVVFNRTSSDGKEEHLNINELLIEIEKFKNEIVQACAGIGTCSQASMINQSYRNGTLEQLLDFSEGGDES